MLPTIKLLLSIGILSMGLLAAWHYLLRPKNAGDDRAAAVFGDRPWRRLGGGIAAVVAIMFVLGAYVVDIPDRPWPYAIYWAVILGMVMWLGALAMKDLRHTRRVVQTMRAKQKSASTATEGE